MSSARELAIDILPFFERNVLAGRVYSYGHYANAIGRSAAKESMIIGKAMHAIGAVCVMAKVPIAPLFYVERADGEGARIFESDPHESISVLPYYNLLYVTARNHKYTAAEFKRIHKALAEVLPKYMRPDQLSPHDIWHWVIYTKLKDGSTPLQVGLDHYRSLLAASEVAQNAR